MVNLAKNNFYFCSLRHDEVRGEFDNEWLAMIDPSSTSYVQYNNYIEYIHIKNISNIKKNNIPKNHTNEYKF